MVRSRQHATREYRAARKRFRYLACIYCGKVGTEQEPTTVEHLVPVAMGGKGGDNLAPACAKCNYSRGSALGKQRKKARQREAGRGW